MKFVELPDDIAHVLQKIPREKRGDFLLGHGFSLKKDDQKINKVTEQKNGICKEVYIFSDGASRGNPGEAGAGYLITDSDGNILYEGRKYLGIATNNIAEWTALFLALETAHKMNMQEVKCFLDSELVVKQMNGAYKVKNPDLRILFEKTKILQTHFQKISFAHIPREQNSHADRLSNEAIEQNKF
ncbi:ribonuclease HI family protein [Candidatus Peregrinibacteria bacterium]|nr:ribonuclease HI family protein [Candidatus Peregrinibacteria bacterium]